MLPTPLYRLLPLIYLLAGVACIAFLQPPFNVVPAVVFIVLSATIFYKRVNYRTMNSRTRVKRPRARTQGQKKSGRELNSAEAALGKSLSQRPQRSVVDRRTNTAPVSFPLVDSWNRVIPKDRRRSSNRLKD